MLKYWDIKILSLGVFEILKHWDIETLIYRNIDILVYWDIEIFRYWDIWILEHCYFGILRYWNLDMLWYRDIGIQRYWNKSFVWALTRRNVAVYAHAQAYNRLGVKLGPIITGLKIVTSRTAELTEAAVEMDVPVAKNARKWSQKKYMVWS